MASRYRGNFLYGTLSGFNTTQTTFTGTGFPSQLTTGTYLPVVINPGYNGATASGEIVYVTSVAAGGVITVSGGRGREGTTATSGSTGTQWVAGPLASDFGISNQIANGDFPTPASGQLLVGTSASGAAFTSAVSGLTISGSTLSGSTFAANNSIVGGSDGQLLAISGSNIVPLSITTSGAYGNGPVYNNNAGTNSNAIVTITMSGHLTYQVWGRAAVFAAASGGVATIALQAGGITFSTSYPSIIQATTYQTANEYSQMATYIASSRNPVLFSFLISNTAGQSPNNIGSAYAVLQVTGIG